MNNITVYYVPFGSKYTKKKNKYYEPVCVLSTRRENDQLTFKYVQVGDKKVDKSKIARICITGFWIARR